MVGKCETYKMATVKEAEHRGWCQFCSKKCENNLKNIKNNCVQIKKHSV
jgi:hypothetical protein